MKTTLWILVTCLASSGAISAQEMIRETHFTGKEITTIQAEGCWQIILSQGEQTGVQLSMDTRLKPYYTCQLTDRTVHLNMVDLPSSKQSLLRTYDNWPTVHITLSTLDGLEASGCNRIQAEQPIHAHHCSIDLSGVCYITDLSLRVNSLQYTQSGVTQTSDFSVTAQQDIQLNVSGVSKLRHASLCSAGTLHINASGMASVSAKVNVHTLEVETSGMAHASIEGHAVLTDFQESSLSQLDISKLEPNRTVQQHISSKP